VATGGKLSSQERELLEKMLTAIGQTLSTVRMMDLSESAWQEGFSQVPGVILVLGGPAASGLLGTGLESSRGRILSWKGHPLVATWHPADLLADPGLKRQAWEDLKLLRSLMQGEGV
jgi:hypothetical protein